MTREKFDSLYLGKAVHCETEEKANEFLALADSVGYRWRNGESLIEENAWEKYKNETCYNITKDGVSFDSTRYFNLGGYQIIEYQLQLKFKVGDRVRIKIYPLNSIDGKIGVVEKLNPLSWLPYLVKINDDYSSVNWYFYEHQLEKVEEPTYKEETIDDIIEEIKDHQKSINVLLNRLATKGKGE